MSCDYCRTYNVRKEVRDTIERLFSEEVTHCPFCGTSYVMMDFFSELARLKMDPIETVEIDGETLEVEREQLTFRFDEDNAEYRTVGIDLDSVNIDKELDILGLNEEGEENEHG